MGSIQRQESLEYFESFDNEDCNISVDLVEPPPTLAAEELDRAREEALYILKTKSPEEAVRIFTQLNLKDEVDKPMGPGEGKAQAVKSPNVGEGSSKTTVPGLPKN